MVTSSVYYYLLVLDLLLLHVLMSVDMDACGPKQTTKDIGAEYRHDLRPAVQLPLGLVYSRRP